jgi:hypothetical protein
MMSFIALLTGILFTTASAQGTGSLSIVATPITSAQSVVRGAQRVPMLSLAMSASCDAPITLESVTVFHRGRGEADDLSAVYAFRDGKRLSRAARFDAREQRAVIRLRGLRLAPCESTTLLLLADIATDSAAGGEHVVELRRADDVSAPGATVSIDAGKAGTSRISAAITGAITVTPLSLPRRIEYGTDRTVLRIKLESDGKSGHLIDAITFTNEGKARNADLKNLWIGNTRGERLSNTVPAMDGEAVRITFEKPLTLAKNDGIVLLLHADALASRTRTIQFSIEEPSDIEARAFSGRVPR